MYHIVVQYIFSVVMFLCEMIICDDVVSVFLLFVVVMCVHTAAIVCERIDKTQCADT